MGTIMTHDNFVSIFLHYVLSQPEDHTRVIPYIIEYFSFIYCSVKFVLEVFKTEFVCVKEI